MKNKFLKMFDYLRHLITNENPDTRSEVIKRKVSTEDNLRWQDDGGPVVDNTKPTPPVTIDRATQPTDVAKKD